MSAVTLRNATRSGCEKSGKDPLARCSTALRVELEAGDVVPPDGSNQSSPAVVDLRQDVAAIRRAYGIRMNEIERGLTGRDLGEHPI
jgi:hypothetical protein